MKIVLPFSLNFYDFSKTFSEIVLPFEVDQQQTFFSEDDTRYYPFRAPPSTSTTSAPLEQLPSNSSSAVPSARVKRMMHPYPSIADKRLTPDPLNRVEVEKLQSEPCGGTIIAVEHVRGQPTPVVKKVFTTTICDGCVE